MLISLYSLIILQEFLVILKLNVYALLLFLEHKVNRQDQKDKAYKVIESELLVLEDCQAEDDKDGEGYHLLDDLQLHEREGTTCADKSHSVGWYLKTVFKECYDPAYRYHTDKWK